jgi:hypothetical protein
VSAKRRRADTSIERSAPGLTILQLDPNLQIRLFVKLKLAICARAGNRAGLFHDQRSNPLRRFRAAGGAARRSTSAVKFKTKENP